MNAVLERGKVASRFSLESIAKMAGRVAALAFHKRSCL
jgi:hypothetical protein